MIDKEYYTVVFRGDGKEMAKKLFDIIEPYGEVVSVSLGDALTENERLEKEIKSLRSFNCNNS